MCSVCVCVFGEVKGRKIKNVQGKNKKRRRKRRRDKLF